MIKRVGERVIFQTKLFTVKDIDLQAPKGNVTFQIVEKKDTALIVPIIGEDVILIKEYFAAIDAYSLSVPKGRVEEGNNPLDTANKELQEEIGYKAGRLEQLTTFTLSPGYLAQKTHVFLAEELTESKLEGDEIEEVEIVRYPFAKFEELIGKGDLSEARVIAALFLARNHVIGKHML
ncbi:MAG: NUDIX domain-containing protein [Patescibacteria group bacterium]|nr:NUDIX domain-containing protein [Patescibacteria group bacterium]MDE2590493.1 NUDIX domain-containing protein [Patescibacteria group bacterium]